MSPETTKNYIHLPIQPKAKFKATSIKWITISEDEGIYAYSAIPKGKKGADSQVITYVFDKKTFPRNRSRNPRSTLISTSAFRNRSRKSRKE